MKLAAVVFILAIVVIGLAIGFSADEPQTAADPIPGVNFLVVADGS